MDLKTVQGLILALKVSTKNIRPENGECDNEHKKL